MRILSSRCAALLAVSALAGALLVGCAAEPEPASSPTTTPDAAAPLFASDEEALAAAEAAYAVFQDVSNQISWDGGEGVEALEPLLSAELYSASVVDAEGFRRNGWRAEGATTFDTVKLQQHTQDGASQAIVVYLCVDVGQTTIYDSQRIDVTQENRATRLPVVVGFVVVDSEDHSLLIDSRKKWSGDNFC